MTTACISLAMVVLVTLGTNLAIAQNKWTNLVADQTGQAVYTDPLVVSAQETEYKFPFSTRNDNYFASGDGFVNLCAWGRSNWPA